MLSTKNISEQTLEDNTSEPCGSFERNMPLQHSVMLYSFHLKLNFHYVVLLSKYIYTLDELIVNIMDDHVQ